MEVEVEVAVLAPLLRLELTEASESTDETPLPLRGRRFRLGKERTRRRADMVGLLLLLFLCVVVRERSPVVVMVVVVVMLLLLFGLYARSVVGSPCGRWRKGTRVKPSNPGPVV